MGTAKESNKPKGTRAGTWLQHLNVAVLRRSFVVAVIIGSALTLLNQTEAVFGDAAFDWFRLVLVLVTPFLVITLSQLVATQQAVNDALHTSTAVASKPLIKTFFSHNIPSRALVIALITGSATSSLVLVNAFSQTGSISAVPIPVLVQFYLLPLVFGIFSQALAYRRSATIAIL